MYLQPIAPLVLSSPSMPQPTGAYALAPSGWGGMALGRQGQGVCHC